MANRPHPDRKAVTWRLHRDLVTRVQAAAERQQETVLAFVTRALTRELDDLNGRRGDLIGQIDRALFGCEDGGFLPDEDTSVPVGEFRRLLHEVAAPADLAR